MIRGRTMVEDPKKIGAPEHPSGFPVADDGPAHVAPAIDVRPKARARNPLPQPAPKEESGDVPFSLAIPAEERTSQHRAYDLDSEKTIDEAMPMTVDFERNMPTLHHVRAIPLDPADEVTLHPVPEPITKIGKSNIPIVPVVPRSMPGAAIEPESEDEDQMSQRDALILDIAAIGPVDERPDRSSERSVASRASLARARALRFRLSLLDAWPAGQMPRAAAVPAGRQLHIDLTLDCALLAAIADGAKTPPRTAPGSALFPFVAPLASILLSYRPDLPRTALRDRGAASIARLTIVGWKTACDHLARAGKSAPVDARRLALEIAARIAYVPPMNSERLGALNDIESALELATGSAALAIDQARRGIER